VWARARAAARQIRRIRVGHLFRQDSNRNLTDKCRKFITYSTTGLSVKNGASRVLSIISALLLVAAASASRAQRNPPDQGRPAPFINKVILNGNRSISDKVLKRQMKTRAPSWYNIFNKPRLNETVLNRDIARLEGYYHSAGFFEATAQLDRLDYTEEGRFVDIVISIDEGQPTVVEAVEFSPNTLIDENDLRKNLLLKPGEPYNSSYLATDVYTIQSKYFDKGYLAVSIDDKVDITGYRATIHFDISPGTQIRIRNIEISGNVLSKTAVVEKEIAFDSGDVCRLSKLVETQRNLYETGLFTVVDINPENLDPLERTVDIHVRVRERKAAFIEGGFGVGNIVGSRIFARWGTRNLLGTGRGLRLSTEYGFDLFEGDVISVNNLQFENNFWRYDVEYFQRYIFGLKTLLELDFYTQKDATVQNLDVRSVGGQILTRRRLSRHTDMLLGFTDEFIRRKEFGVAADEGEVRFLTNSYSNDRRDFLLNPRTGVYRFLRLKFAGGFLGGDSDFYTASVSSQWYFPLAKSDVFAVRVRVGYGDHFGQSNSVPIEDRYFAGGSNSVRGYKNNSLGPKSVDSESGEVSPRGGNALLLTNLELRFGIPVLSRINISGAAFFDGGNVWETWKHVKLGDFKLFKSSSDVTIDDYFYGVGVGIRYNTPIGPIRLDYGIPLKTLEGDSDNGMFYLALGQTF
jgi:outer membrane protein insertion porin family